MRPRSAPRSISADQLTDTMCVGTPAAFARCSNDTAPFCRGIRRPACTSAARDVLAHRGQQMIKPSIDQGFHGSCSFGVMHMLGIV